MSSGGPIVGAWSRLAAFARAGERVSSTEAAHRDDIRRLVARFQATRADISSPRYNETSLRTDFLDGLLRCLGWDVDNRKGLSQDLREVVQEATVDVPDEPHTKKPDYAFRVGRQVRFFLEAKKPAVRVPDDPAAAFQARRYGFSASHPICVLSNFDTTVIYDTREPPREEDDPRSGIVARFSSEELVSRFDELNARISRAAAYDGRFDAAFLGDERRFVLEHFDQFFLTQIDSWRKILAADIARRNPAVGEVDLNYFVQRLLNRIVFLRICEDRDLERYESLRAVADSNGSYEELKALFRRAEGRYNSGLFTLIDDSSMNLDVGTDALFSVLLDLYHPRSPYTFSVVEPTVLGAIYERFLSHRLELDARRSVRVVEKAEPREAGGVFVTPRFIVDEIVRRTLDPLLRDKRPDEVSSLTFADIACGSGTFLLGVFAYLQAWHINWYLQDGIDRHRSRVYEAGRGQYTLTLAEKRRILLNNVYGVDIDDQAAEVTRFGLLLMLLENESDASLEAHPGAALPPLEKNVKSGNSLVETGPFRRFLPTAPAKMWTAVHPFDWEREFPWNQERREKFDAILGNPPYVRIQNMKRYASEEVAFYQSADSGFTCAAQDNFDKYQLFVERAVSLLRPGGRLGYIIPNKFLVLRSGKALRRLLSRARLIRSLVDFGVQQVFSTSTTYTCLLLQRYGS